MANAEEQIIEAARHVQQDTTARRLMVSSVEDHGTEIMRLIIGADGYSICHLTYAAATAIATVYKGDAL
jgi:uncharacterized protein YbcI